MKAGLGFLPRCHAPEIVGGALRLASLWANREFPHGDVGVDAAVCRSLSRGLGFWFPWEEGAVLSLPDPVGTTADTFGRPADAHGPLWPLLGAPIAAVTRDGYLALQVLSWITGILTIVAARRLFARFAEGEAGERAGRLAAWGVALSLLLCDYSGNGSLYAGQCLATLLLPLAAGSLASASEALAAGAVLGAGYLVSYQAALFIPLFTLAAAVALGPVRALRPLVLAGAACLAVALPWFARNAIVFGDPLHSSNAAFFDAKVGPTWIDTTAARPRMVIDPGYGDLWGSLRTWTSLNTGYLLAMVAVALPGLAWFAPGGLARMLGIRRGARPSLAGMLLLGEALALFATAAICPQPRTRHVVPLLPILAGAAAVELARGPRVLPALAAAAAAYGGLWWCGLAQFTAHSREWWYVAGTIPLAIAAAVPALRPRLGPLALAALALLGAARVVATTDASRCTAAFGPPAQIGAWTPTPTFYETLADPWNEGAVREVAAQMTELAGALEAEGCALLYADVAFRSSWPRRLLTCRGRVEWPFAPRIIPFFGADAVVVPNGILGTSALDDWLVRQGASKVRETRSFTAWKIPRKE